MNYEYDKLYIRPYGSSGAYAELPYTVEYYDENGELQTQNTLPENDVSVNDVDLDAYTNTGGYTVRNRVRHDVPSLDFNIPTMSGEELHMLFNGTTTVWLECIFFYEPAWDFVTKKMYRSGTVKYHRYYVDKSDPDKNIYQNVQFSLIEE